MLGIAVVLGTTLSSSIKHRTFRLGSEGKDSTMRVHLGAACCSDSMLLQVVAFVLGIAAVLWTTLSSSMEHRTFGLGSEGKDSATALPYRFDWFHGVFLLASCYTAMLFCGWSLNEVRLALCAGQRGLCCTATPCLCG